MYLDNLPAGANLRSDAPYNENEKQIDIELIIENYIDHILNKSTMPFDEIGYLIDLLRDSKHKEKIDDILTEFN